MKEFNFLVTSNKDTLIEYFENSLKVSTLSPNNKEKMNLIFKKKQLKKILMLKLKQLIYSIC